LERPIEIRSITRLKFRDRNNNNELRDSLSIKIEFLSSNFFPEFILIWSVRSRIRPFMNKVRKCYNCLKWGHFSAFCRGSSVCSGCGGSHNSDSCSNSVFICPDCNQNHSPFDVDCNTFQKYKVINHIMAYCNVNQFNVKKLAKIRNITSCDQVEKNFKSSAYLTWNNVDYSREDSRSIGLRTHPSSLRNFERNNKNRRKSFRRNYTSTSDLGQMMSDKT